MSAGLGPNPGIAGQGHADVRVLLAPAVGRGYGQADTCHVDVSRGATQIGAPVALFERRARRADPGAGARSAWDRPSSRHWSLRFAALTSNNAFIGFEKKK